MNILPLFNVLQNGFEVWETREPTHQEFSEKIKAKMPIYEAKEKIKVRLLKKIFTSEQAITYCLEKNGYCNSFEHFIDNELKTSHVIQKWLSCMPTEIPYNLLKYKKDYPKFNSSAVDQEIITINHSLSSSQQLIRASKIDLWNIGDSLITDTPLSSSFCPQIALRNINHEAKAYDYGRIDMIVINVINPATPVFFYNPEQAMGHEKEVLFSSGAKLILKKRTLLKENHTVHKIDLTKTPSTQSKDVPVYLVEIDLE